MKQIIFQKITQLTFCLLISFNLNAKYPQYKEIPSKEKTKLANISTSGSYLDDIYTSNIPRASVGSVLELGSRDCIDALKLSEYYKCHVFAFECNPEVINICKNNIKDNPNVSLVPLAVWNKTDKISFFPILEKKNVCFNQGASSCFKVSPDGHHKTYAQKEVTVQATRLDEWLTSKKISSIDLICMDVQGAALQVLEGMGKYLDNVKYIIAELEHKRIYLDQILFSDVEKFLEQKGFKMYVGKINRFFGDYLFVRKDIIVSWWGEE